MPPLVNFAQVKRVAFRAESTGLIKQLSGFARGHSIPDRDTASARKFISRLAADDIRADIDQVYQALRESFGFKRRQLESSLDDGCGVIRTPCFVYSVNIAVDADDATQVLWRREIASLRDLLVIRTPAFQSVFGARFNSLVFEFAKSIPIATVVDQLEEEDRPGMMVHCASDASWSEIALNGFRGTVRIEPKAVTISGGRASPASSLLEQFLAFVERQARRDGEAALKYTRPK